LAAICTDRVRIYQKVTWRIPVSVCHVWSSTVTTGRS